MQKHWHTGIENIAIYGLSAILVLNLIRIAAAKATQSSNAMVANAGKVAGSLVGGI